MNNIMPIKYGELTIIYNKEQTIFTSLVTWLKGEEHLEKNCKYIFLFDDGEICDSNDKWIDFKFYFFDSCASVIPPYFEKSVQPIGNQGNQGNQETKKRNIYFHKTHNTEPNNCLSHFNPLFSLYSKYDCRITMQSEYNSIYYCHTPHSQSEIFGLIRIKSNEYMPRFQFAYDNDEFTKEEIVYVIHHIFNPALLHNEPKHKQE